MNEKDYKKYSFLKKKEIRKLRARKKKNKEWYDLRFIGLIGWSIVLPTLIGTLTGIWIDKKFNSKYSWTLILLLFGLIGGCINVWWWLNKEEQEMNEEEKEELTQNDSRENE